MLYPKRYRQVDHTVNDLTAPLLDALFAQDQWSQRYLHSLAPLPNETLIQSVFHLSSHEMVSRVETFHFQHSGHAAIRFKAALASLIGQPERLALIVQILDGSHAPVGFWRKTYWRTAQHELECHFDMIKTRLDVEALRGISTTLKPYFDRLNQALGVAREFLEADWIGRLVWANYYDIDETHSYIEDGQRLSTLEVLHRNFERFLTWHGLRLCDLDLAAPAGKLPLTHLAQLTSPGDFARVEHRHGTLVEVEVLLDDPPRQVERQSLPVGKAFMLADFTPSPDNTVELIDGYYGERLSDRAMPYWFGVKHASPPCPSSPNVYEVDRFERHEIVIIGAGLAGLTTAARLEDAGLQPVVYEANPTRVGGRIQSLALQRRAGQLFLGEQWLASESASDGTTLGTYDETLGIIEAGGEFIGSHHTALQSLAHDLGLGLIKVEPSLHQPHILVSPSAGTALTLHAFAAQHEPLLDRIREVWHRWRQDGLSPWLATLPLGRFFQRLAAPEGFCEVIGGFVRAQFGTDLHRVTLHDWFDMHPFDERGDLALFASDEFSYRMKGGMQQLTRALEGQLTQPVRTGHTLTELRSAEDSPYVLDFRDPRGKRLRVFADFVILALPVNPLKRDIVFDLPVDASRALGQTSRLPMGHNAKTIAFFRQPFWRACVPDSFFYLSAPDFTLWEPAMETTETTLHPLVVYTGGTTAQLAAEPEALMARLFAHLDSTFPAIRHDFVTAVPLAHWPSCPHTQGSYTGFGTDATDFDHLHGRGGPLGHSHLTLAGAALSLEFRGFAEGAVETGLKAAQRILQLV